MKIIKYIVCLLLIVLCLPFGQAEAAFRSVATTIATVPAGAAPQSVTATAPAGVAANDILIAAINSDNGTQTLTCPTAWTLASTDHITNGDGETLFWCWKVATGTDSYVFTFNVATNVDTEIVVAAYSGRSTVSPINATSANNPNSGTPPNSPVSVAGTTITPTVNNCDIVWMGGVDAAVTGNGAWTAPGGTTLRSTTPSANFAPTALADLTQTTAAATGALTGVWTQSGDHGNFVGYIVALAPSGTVARQSRLSLLGVGP